MYLMMATIMLLLLCVAYLGYLAGHYFGFRARLEGGDKKNDDKKKPQRMQKVFHDVAAQGPVRYTRKCDNPRFVPMSDGSWGSNVEATWIYESTGTTKRRAP